LADGFRVSGLSNEMSYCWPLTMWAEFTG
jgi:hypothetical protein